MTRHLNASSGVRSTAAIPTAGAPTRPRTRDGHDGQSRRAVQAAYTGRLEWGTLQARTYYQYTKHEMDFGDDRRYWSGPGQPPARSGGDAARGTEKRRVAIEFLRQNLHELRSSLPPAQRIPFTPPHHR
jgi:hypothetical protein